MIQISSRFGKHLCLISFGESSILLSYFSRLSLILLPQAEAQTTLLTTESKDEVRARMVLVVVVEEDLKEDLVDSEVVLAHQVVPRWLEEDEDGRHSQLCSSYSWECRCL